MLGPTSTGNHDHYWNRWPLEEGKGAKKSHSIGVRHVPRRRLNSKPPSEPYTRNSLGKELREKSSI